jgi:hypothetical protein
VSLWRWRQWEEIMSSHSHSGSGRTRQREINFKLRLGRVNTLAPSTRQFHRQYLCATLNSHFCTEKAAARVRWVDEDEKSVSSASAESKWDFELNFDRILPFSIRSGLSPSSHRLWSYHNSVFVGKVNAFGARALECRCDFQHPIFLFTCPIISSYGRWCEKCHRCIQSVVIYVTGCLFNIIECCSLPEHFTTLIIGFSLSRSQGKVRKSIVINQTLSFDVESSGSWRWRATSARSVENFISVLQVSSRLTPSYRLFPKRAAGREMTLSKLVCFFIAQYRLIWIRCTNTRADFITERQRSRRFFYIFSTWRWWWKAILG